MSKYKDGEVLSIVYDVWISGTQLNMEKKQCINSIDIKETVEGADTATIQITDPEFLFIEDNIFIEENTIDIKMGWSNSTYRIEFSGYISALDIEFTTSGVPRLTLTCMDNTHRMNRKKNDKTFKDKTNAEVVKEIVKSYGYKCVVDSDYSFTKKETITQSKQTDIDFLQKLAKDEVHPFTARLVGDTFYYVRMGKYTTPKMTLTYRNYPHEIISFSPKINKETKRTEISKSKVNTSNKSVSKSEAVTKVPEGAIHKSSTPRTEYSYNSQTGTWTETITPIPAPSSARDNRFKEIT